MNKENDRLRIPDSNSLEKDSCFYFFLGGKL